MYIYLYCYSTIGIVRVFTMYNTDVQCTLIVVLLLVRCTCTYIIYCYYCTCVYNVYHGGIKAYLTIKCLRQYKLNAVISMMVTQCFDNEISKSCKYAIGIDTILLYLSN